MDVFGKHLAEEDDISVIYTDRDCLDGMSPQATQPPEFYMQCGSDKPLTSTQGQGASLHALTYAYSSLKERYNELQQKNVQLEKKLSQRYPSLSSGVDNPFGSSGPLFENGAVSSVSESLCAGNVHHDSELNMVRQQLADKTEQLRKQTMECQRLQVEMNLSQCSLSKEAFQSVPVTEGSTEPDMRHLLMMVNEATTELNATKQIVSRQTYFINQLQRQLAGTDAVDMAPGPVEFNTPMRASHSDVISPRRSSVTRSNSQRRKLNSDSVDLQDSQGFDAFENFSGRRSVSRAQESHLRPHSDIISTRDKPALRARSPGEVFKSSPTTAPIRHFNPQTNPDLLNGERSRSGSRGRIYEDVGVDLYGSNQAVTPQPHGHPVEETGHEPSRGGDSTFRQETAGPLLDLSDCTQIENRFRTLQPSVRRPINIERNFDDSSPIGSHNNINPGLSRNINLNPFEIGNQSDPIATGSSAPLVINNDPFASNKVIPQRNIFTGPDDLTTLKTYASGNAGSGEEWKCPVCEQIFLQNEVTLYDFEEHASTCGVNTDSVPERACPVCREVFSDTTAQAEFERHVENHFNEYVVVDEADQFGVPPS